MMRVEELLLTSRQGPEPREAPQTQVAPGEPLRSPLGQHDVWPLELPGCSADGAGR